MVTELIHDICLLRFYEERNNTTLFLEPLEVVSVKKYFPDYEKRSIPSFSLIPERTVAYYFERFAQQYNKRYVKSLLEKGQGRISMCGKHITELKDTIVFADFLFFHSCSELERDNIIKEFLDNIPDNFRITKEEDRIIVEVAKLSTIYLHFKIYKDEEDLFLSFNYCGKHGWNPKRGYFCSVLSALFTTLSNAMPDMDLIFIEETGEMEEIIMPIFPVSILDYKNKEYRPNIVGIPYDQYLMFYRYRIKFGINYDVFRLLCDLWLKTLVYEVRKKLIL